MKVYIDLLGMLVLRMVYNHSITRTNQEVQCMNNGMKIMMATVLVATVIAGALFMSGCVGPTEEGTTEVTTVLPVMPWSWWSMFYTAENQGYYAEEGLNVNFVYTSEGGYGVVKQVAAGQGQFGFAGGDTSMVARSNNIPVVTVYQQDHSTMWNIISLNDSGINNLTDLEGKTIAIQGPENPLHLAAKGMLNNVGVDCNTITWIPVGGTGIISALVGGDVDAVTGHGMYKIVLENQGIEFNTWYARDYGVDFVSMGIIVSEDTIENDPELVEKFVRASNKGLEYAIEYPEEAVDAYVETFNPSANKEIELELWNICIDQLIQPDKYPLGQFNRSQWVMTQDTLYDLGAMDKKVDIGEAYTEEFVERIAE
jgi:ABC-type nitrate/sulfonate/bicarbonate transport system substrate-binding protein